jgi:uncharacterized protein YigA (DUF484 family)
MSGSEDAAQVQPESLTAETVSAWLRRHPDFLHEYPEVLTFLTPPEFKRGERIVDMQRFMLDRMKDDLSDLRRREKQLISAVEGNAAGQSKVHQAVLAVVGASDIHALALTGANAIGTGGIANLMGPRRRVLLQGNTLGEAIVFGGEAERVKSVAYLRLRTGKNSPTMLLALGSGRDDGFDRQQGTELITFLADVLEERMKQCLGPKN